MTLRTPRRRASPSSLLTLGGECKVPRAAGAFETAPTEPQDRALTRPAMDDVDLDELRPVAPAALAGAAHPKVGVQASPRGSAE